MLLTYADVCQALTDVHELVVEACIRALSALVQVLLVQSTRMLTYADVCCRILTFPDVS